ncbi:ATP-binding protein [Methanocorpusculum sp.]|nr:ATP-binding protein [Methanocorpusculum sp.]
MNKMLTSEKNTDAVSEKEMDNSDVILLPDPERIIEGLRDTGYTFNTAVADIIDNSLAADATKVDVIINRDPKNGVTIYVADNGTGMDAEGLRNAMKYGSNKRENAASLGKFGLGLKTASTAFCRCLSVVSRGNGDSKVRKVQWDLDYVAQKNEWCLKVPVVTEDELELLDETADGGTGTLVVWEKVDRLLKQYIKEGNEIKALKRTVDDLRFHISMVYQRFLDPEDDRERTVQISVDGIPVEAWDPFCLKEEMTQLVANEKIDVDIDDERPSSFTVRAFVTPRAEEFSTPEARKNARGSNNDMQGFYVYRENRLIHSGDWFGMFSKEPHGSLLRVEFSFDHTLDDAFNVDIKKSRIILNEAIFDYLKNEFLPAPRRAADERYRKGEKKEVAKKGKDAHDASNKNIDSKADELDGGVKTNITGKDEVELTNDRGTFRHKITIRSQEKDGQTRIIPVDSLDDGLLWRPCIVDGDKAVELNQSHPYYQKVYYPVLSRNVMVTGMDSLLWALGLAELATVDDRTADQYEELRYRVSRTLKKLVADLPDPDIGRDDEQ